MATRRKYRPRKYRDGGRVVSDMAVAADAVPDGDDNPLPPQPEPNRVIEALAAQRRAEEMQRHHAAQSTPTHQQAPQAQQLPERAQAWLRQHPEYAQDPVLNEQLGALHHYITKVDRIEPFSPAYFDAVDTKLGFKAVAPAAPTLAPAAPQRRSMPMSAPVTRDIPQAAGRRPDGWNTLTAEERKIARNSFIDPSMSDQDKELLYLRNKQKYLSMKADGSYSDQGNG